MSCLSARLGEELFPTDLVMLLGVVVNLFPLNMIWYRAIRGAVSSNIYIVAHNCLKDPCAIVHHIPSI